MAFTLDNSRVVSEIQTPIGKLTFGDTVEFYLPLPAVGLQEGVVTGILISATDRNAWSIQIDEKYELDSYGNGGMLVQKKSPGEQNDPYQAGFDYAKQLSDQSASSKRSYSEREQALRAQMDPVVLRVRDMRDHEMGTPKYNSMRMFELVFDNILDSDANRQVLAELPDVIKRRIGKYVALSIICEQNWIEAERKLLQAQRELKADFKDKDPGKRSRYSEAQARAALEAAQGDVVKAFAILRG